MGARRQAAVKGDGAVEQSSAAMRPQAEGSRQQSSAIRQQSVSPPRSAIRSRRTSLAPCPPRSAYEAASAHASSRRRVHLKVGLAGSVYRGRSTMAEAQFNLRECVTEQADVLNNMRWRCGEDCRCSEKQRSGRQAAVEQTGRQGDRRAAFSLSAVLWSPWPSLAVLGRPWPSLVVLCL